MYVCVVLYRCASICLCLLFNTFMNVHSCYLLFGRGAEGQEVGGGGCIVECVNVLMSWINDN